MSFYIGKNPNPICHVTANPQDITVMRGDVMSDTVFHSNINYITFKEYTLTKIGTADLQVWTYYFLGTKYQTRTCSIYEDIPEMRNAIALNYAFECTNTSLPRGVLGPIRLWSDVTTGTSAYGNNAGYPSGTHPYLALPGGPDTIKVFVFNFKVDGSIDPLAEDPTAEIFLKGTDGGNAQFIVNGRDIGNLRYLNKIVMNANDAHIQWGSKSGSPDLLLTNESTAGGPIKIQCTPTTGTQVFVNNNKIIDSTLGTAGFRIIDSGTQTVPSFTFGSSWNGTSYAAPIGRPLVDGEIIFFTIKVNGLDGYTGSFTRAYGAASVAPSVAGDVYVNRYIQTTVDIIWQRNFQTYVPNDPYVPYRSGCSGVILQNSSTIGVYRIGYVQSISVPTTSVSYPTISVSYVIIG